MSARGAGRNMAHELHDALPRPRPLWSALLLPVLFLTCGAVIGSTLTYWAMQEPDRFGPPAPGEMPAKITLKLRDDLNLDDDQAKRVEGVFLRSEEEMERIRLKTAPEMDAQFSRVEAEIAALLRPEQLEPWHLKCEEMRQRLQSRRPPNAP